MTAGEEGGELKTRPVSTAQDVRGVGIPLSSPWTNGGRVGWRPGHAQRVKRKLVATMAADAQTISKRP